MNIKLEYSDLYFFTGDGPGRKRTSLIPGGGLESFLKNAKILERRVIVDHPEEIQHLLDQGVRLTIYKMRLNQEDKYRFKSAIILDSSNAKIEGDDLVFNGSRRPVAANNVYPEDANCIHQFMVKFEERYDLSLRQQRRLARKRQNEEFDVVAKPSPKPSPKAGPREITDEEAAKLANAEMQRVTGKPGINPLIK